MPKPPKNLKTFESLVDVIAHLRGPEGCPWDKKQTHKSLTPYLIEESYELIEEINNSNPTGTMDELGDVLLQVLLHSQIAQDQNQFNIYDVIENINQKMIRRHPHVFSDTSLATASEVSDNWDKIKASEKKGSPQNDSLIPLNAGLPAWISSLKIGKKTAQYNFDFNNQQQCAEKVDEELLELKEVLGNNKYKQQQEHELGDLLFSVLQLARHLNIDPETALLKTNNRFLKRFNLMYKLMELNKFDFIKTAATAKEIFWKKAKKLLATSES